MHEHKANKIGLAYAAGTGERNRVKKFVGRSMELQFLNEYFQREGSQILVVYGSKGVGKTALLQEFCRDKKHSYYLARACSEREQRFQWGAELCAEGRELNRYPEYAELFENAAARKETEKQVIVIDEFHHMVKGDGAFFETLLRYVEGRLLSRPLQGGLHLQLCGSGRHTGILDELFTGKQCGGKYHSQCALSGKPPV